MAERRMFAKTIIDSDAFYDHDDYQNAKNVLIEHPDINVTYCEYINYYRDYRHLLVWPFKSYVPFISKVSYKFDFFNGSFDKPSDPTRRYLIEGKDAKYCIMSFSTVKMHHLSWIRTDIREKLKNWSAKKYFNDDYYALCEEYYSLVSDVVNKTSCSIIGHFDLVTKFNEIYHLWDEKDPRYIASWKKAVDALIPYHIPFEINLGGITRGKKTTPYPSFEIIEYIKSKGGTFILSSDSHNKENILKDFSKYEYLLK